MSHSYGSHSTSNAAVPESPSRHAWTAKQADEPRARQLRSCFVQQLTQGDHPSNLRITGAYMFRTFAISQDVRTYRVVLFPFFGSSSSLATRVCCLFVFSCCLCCLHSCYTPFQTLGASCFDISGSPNLLDITFIVLSSLYCVIGQGAVETCISFMGFDLVRMVRSVQTKRMIGTKGEKG